MTFCVEDVVITISDRGLDRILTELQRLDRPQAPLPYAEARRLIEQHIARKDQERLELPPSTDEAVARALDQLRRLGSFAQPLQRLRDALVASTAPETMSYKLRLVGDWVETGSLTSYTGRYEKNDHLPLPQDGKCWCVIWIEPPATVGADETLVCEPCDNSAHPESP